MYIRYLNNIHILDNYYSVVKSGNNTCINLVKHDGGYLSLEFRDNKARDFFLNQIWLEIEKGTKFFDIDNIIDAFYDSNKYNL